MSNKKNMITSDKERKKLHKWEQVMREAVLPQTDLSILCDVRMPYSGQTSHFRRLEINMERTARQEREKGRETC